MKKQLRHTGNFILKFWASTIKMKVFILIPGTIVIKKQKDSPEAQVVFVDIFA